MASGVVLVADYENLGLVIKIRMKNRQTGKFSKNRFLIGHNSSGKNRNLRPKISRI